MGRWTQWLMCTMTHFVDVQEVEILPCLANVMGLPLEVSCWPPKSPGRFQSLSWTT